VNTGPALCRHGKVLDEMLPRMIEETFQKAVDPLFPPPPDATPPKLFDRFELIDMPAFPKAACAVSACDASTSNPDKAGEKRCGGGAAVGASAASAASAAAASVARDAPGTSRPKSGTAAEPVVKRESVVSRLYSVPDSTERQTALGEERQRREVALRAAREMLFQAHASAPADVFADAHFPDVKWDSVPRRFPALKPKVPPDRQPVWAHVGDQFTTVRPLMPAEPTVTIPARHNRKQVQVVTVNVHERRERAMQRAGMQH